jgi:alanyl-tRNA synthetase
MFYPQGGGQMHDVGKINGFQVEEVQKQSGVVLHRAPEHDLEEGKRVKGVVNGEKRKQLTQHHSTTHMVNAAAREELGEHIYQAGAKKDLEKGRLDITHYEKPEKETVREIEASVREMIEDDHDINVKELAKSEAEQKYGFRIYQGGAPPGNVIRLIEIEDIDIEACGGTHLLSTGNAEEFYITDVKRIQDGVIRLEYKAGKAAEEYIETQSEILEKCCDILEAGSERALRPVLEELADIYRVEVEQLPDTLRKFKKEVEDLEDKVERLSELLEAESSFDEKDSSELIESGENLYSRRKDLKKQVENLEDQIEDRISEKASQGRVHEKIPTDNVGLLIQLARQYSSQYDTTVTLIGERGAISASEEGLAVEELEEEGFEDIQGDEGFAKAFN